MKGFANTKLAINEYRRTAPQRQHLCDTAQTDADVEAMLAADEEARKKVCLAFYADTKHINSLEKCLLLDVASAERIAFGKE